MKMVLVSLVTIMAFSSASFAQETTSQNSEKATKAVETVTGKDKMARKKKGESCSKCGKAEGECGCHDHKKEGEAKEGHAGH